MILQVSAEQGIRRWFENGHIWGGESGVCVSVCVYTCMCVCECVYVCVSVHMWVHTHYSPMEGIWRGWLEAVVVECSQQQYHSLQSPAGTTMVSVNTHNFLLMTETQTSSEYLCMTEIISRHRNNGSVNIHAYIPEKR